MIMRIDWKREARAVEADLIALRRDFHRHPEIGNHEVYTTEKISGYLESLGIETHRILDTGVIGVLRNGEGRTVAFRSDIDALPVQEEADVDFKSENEGFMHACGHDLHMTALLGAATLLTRHPEAFSGTVVFIFQPDEEGDGGAQRIIDTGILDKLHVSAVFGAHGHPSFPAGIIGVKYGRFYAAACVYDVTVHGKGTHGAEPENGTDSLYAAARMCAELKPLTEETDHGRSVVTIGEFHAGTARNIISDHAEFHGILRTEGIPLRDEKKQQIKEVIERIAAEVGVHAEISMRDGYVGVTNDDEMTRLVQGCAEQILGADHVEVEEKSTMTTEDFGFYLLRYPGSYFHFGIGSDAPLHSPMLCPDEACLAPAAAVEAAILTTYLMERE